MSDLNVVKRDGSIEPFQMAKIARVAQAAGLSESQAQELATKVDQALKEKNTPQVTTLEIRDIVSKLLHDIDEYAANLYDWYQKVKEDGTP